MTMLSLTPRRRRRLAGMGLTALTYVVLALMLAPIAWLILSSLQTRGHLADGVYDVLHPTFAAFGEMWRAVDFGRYFVNSLIICTASAAIATTLASTVVTFETIEVAVEVTTVCTPPMSFAMRDWISPVRVFVKNASERRWRWR